MWFYSIKIVPRYDVINWTLLDVDVEGRIVKKSAFLLVNALCLLRNLEIQKYGKKPSINDVRALGGGGLAKI